MVWPLKSVPGFEQAAGCGERAGRELRGWQHWWRPHVGEWVCPCRDVQGARWVQARPLLVDAAHCLGLVGGGPAAGAAAACDGACAHAAVQLLACVATRLSHVCVCVRACGCVHASWVCGCTLGFWPTHVCAPVPVPALPVARRRCVTWCPAASRRTPACAPQPHSCWSTSFSRQGGREG